MAYPECHPEAVRTWLKELGLLVGGVLHVLRARGRRWEYVAGPTADLPEVPPVRITIDRETALMVYAETPPDSIQCAALAARARAWAWELPVFCSHAPAGGPVISAGEDGPPDLSLPPSTLVAAAAWLRETDPRRLAILWDAADRGRRDHVGDDVHLRGLVELSNHCLRRCAYCGLRAGRSLQRYRMSAEEILDCARQAVEFGYGTVVLQAGEDPGLSAGLIADIVRRIKAQFPLAVTLSLGEQPEAALACWRAAGADRYLLRFETSDPGLYARIHPAGPRGREDRIAQLLQLRALGYEIGSGVMVGLPGQTYRSLAADLRLFRELDLDMIGLGPFIPHPDTPLGKNGVPAPKDQTRADEETVYKALALARLLCPEANIPSTTALATLNRAQGREKGLQRGANVVMPNLTPERYRAAYEIYPAKVCIHESAADCRGCIRGRVFSIGRRPGSGPGSRRQAAETPA